MPKAILPSDIWVDRKRNVTVTEKTVDQTAKFHMHEYFEIELILDGGGTHTWTTQTIVELPVIPKSQASFLYGSTTLINRFFNSIFVSYKYFTSAMSNNVLKNRIGLIYILILLDCKA